MRQLEYVTCLSYQGCPSLSKRLSVFPLLWNNSPRPIKWWGFQQFPETCVMQECEGTCCSWTHCAAWSCSAVPHTTAEPRLKQANSCRGPCRLERLKQNRLPHSWLPYVLCNTCHPEWVIKRFPLNGALKCRDSLSASINCHKQPSDWVS